MTHRAAIALSGGADSAVTALILREQDYDLFALHLLLVNTPASLLQHDRARDISRRLGIEFQVVDLTQQFAERIVTPFCSEYARGRTPNPCISCNRDIKFGLMLQEAWERGADFLATGHYARVVRTAGQASLLRATDRHADQSYFLYAIDDTALASVLFPLGAMPRKKVRAVAQDEGFQTGQPSQDICFVSEKSYHQFLEPRTSAVPGDIVDTAGKVLGKHKGLPFYTVGQRRGLRLSLEEPRYVLRLDAPNNRVVVGKEDELYVDAALLSDLVWHGGTPATSELDVCAKTRFRSREAPARVTVDKNAACVAFSEPQRAIAPGQSVVFYEGDVVRGGGIITESTRGGTP
ncbi:MAG: tRNA 2-thiouridine(34) synthase MnmA [Dehalococcoidia bacterium]|nr:tRNA 2-thiouridine(34) synthase MnmA [Dehalococcoidia bacterium]